MYNRLKMKLAFLALSCFCFSIGFSQQDEKKTMVINPLKDDMEQMEKKVLKYEDFTLGKLVLRDSLVYDVKMNYHQILDKILFINPKGDTLAISKPENIAYAIIGNDSFFHFKKVGFLQQLTHYPAYNLTARHTLKYIGRENKGPYGTYSPVSSSSSQPDYIVGDLDLQRKMRADEQLLYVNNVQYFISDRFGNFFPANKKNIFDLFSKHDSELKQFVKENDINLNKKSDLEKLLAYIHTL
jgi:hypothetical protein